MSYATEQMQLAKRERGITGGAPNKIDDAVLAKAEAFVNGAWQKYNSTVPTVEGLAMHLGLYRTYIYAARELADTLEQVQRLQASILIERGLTNEYNSGIVKLLLSAKHGYVERTEVANTHEMVAPQQKEVAQDFQAYVNNKTLLTDGTKAQD